MKRYFLIFSIVLAPWACFAKTYLSLGLDGGYISTSEDRSDTVDKSGMHFDTRALVSYHLPRLIIEGGGGWFYNEITGGRYTITSKSGFAEVNLLYKAGRRYTFGLTSQFLLNIDNSFSEYDYVESSEPFLGLQASFTSLQFMGQKNKLRFDLKVMKSMAIEDRDLFMTTVGFTYSIPFGERKKKFKKHKNKYKEVQVKMQGKTTLSSTIYSDTGMYFKTDSNQANKKMSRYLLRLAHFLKKFNTEWKIVHVHGHTDNVGWHDYNLDLSKRRAQTVKRILVQEGVQANKIRTFGHGFNKPISDNSTERGRALNRRVELRYGGVIKRKAFSKGLMLVH